MRKLALEAIEEAAAASHRGPVPRTRGLALALAMTALRQLRLHILGPYSSRLGMSGHKSPKGLIMMKTALLFGSIGTVVESSDIQRMAYNRALKEAGSNWAWDRAVYSELLSQSGGRARLAMLASGTGVILSEAEIATVHSRKTQLAGEALMLARPSPRPGVAALITLAKKRGMKIAFVTSTYRENIDAIFAATQDLSRADFDYVGTRDDVEQQKPAPDPYLAALAKLGVDAAQALAIEDTAISMMSAKRAGIEVVATPGELSGGQDLWQADLILDDIADASRRIDPRLLLLLDR